MTERRRHNVTPQHYREAAALYRRLMTNDPDLDADALDDAFNDFLDAGEVIQVLVLCTLIGGQAEALVGPTGIPNRDPGWLEYVANMADALAGPPASDGWRRDR